MNKKAISAVLFLIFLNTLVYSKNIERIRFVICPSISNLTLWRYGGGGSVDVGIEKNNLYIGGSFDLYQDCRSIEYYDNDIWVLDEKEKDLEGFGLNFKYTNIFNSELFVISPGVRVGYWKTGYWIYAKSDMVKHYDYIVETVIGGPEIEMNIGYRYLYFSVNDILFFGDCILNLIKIGIKIMI
jgi:hypothetical protein